MIFGTLNRKKCDMKIFQNCPSHLSDVATLPWEVQKVLFNSIIHAYFRLFTLSQKKTNCNPLGHPTWKYHHTNLWIAKQTFSSDWMFVVFFQTLRLWRQPVVDCRRWLWKEPDVMCGNWNIRQATLQQVFKVTTFCIKTCFQTFSTLISRVVGLHHAALKFRPCRKKSLPQAATCPNQYTCSSSPPVVCPRRSTRAMQIIGSTKQQ